MDPQTWGFLLPFFLIGVVLAGAIYEFVTTSKPDRADAERRLPTAPQGS